MIDTLTTNYYVQDQRRLLRQAPALAAAAATIRVILHRGPNLSADGRKLARRLVAAILRATAELQPSGPIGHRTIYGAIRQAAHLTNLHLATLTPAGSDAPILDQMASELLAQIEAVDPLMETPVGLAPTLEIILGRVTWRVA